MAFKQSNGTLINQLMNLLRDQYHEGFPVIKEILQNANDAQATRLEVHLVDRLAPAPALFNRPGLLFRNNGPFTMDDQNSIQHFNIDHHASDKDCVGKFGLGQKSLLHYGEAYLVMARRAQGVPYHGVITPWDFEEEQREKFQGNGWAEFDRMSYAEVEAALVSGGWLSPANEQPYFCVWVPLRSDEDCRRPCLRKAPRELGALRQELRAADVVYRTAKTLPMLWNLQQVEFAGVEAAPVRIERVGSGRTAHIMLPSEEVAGVRNQIQGEVNVDGRPYLLYQGLSLKPGGDRLDGFKALPHWPTRVAIVPGEGEQATPEKAYPQAAAVWSRHPHNAGRLTIEWAVFFPLQDQDALPERQVCELELPGHPWGYTLTLHGYFFIDAGRTKVNRLDAIADGGVALTQPSSERELREQWNRAIAIEGSLRAVLPALEQFGARARMDEPTMAALTRALTRSQLGGSETFRAEGLCGEAGWGYAWRSGRQGWQTIPGSECFLLLPREAGWEWDGIPGLARLHERGTTLLAAAQPYLVASAGATQWSPEQLQTALAGLDVSQPRCLDFARALISAQSAAARDAGSLAVLRGLLREVLDRQGGSPSAAAKAFIKAALQVGGLRWCAVVKADVRRALNSICTDTFFLPPNVAEGTPHALDQAGLEQVAQWVQAQPDASSAPDVLTEAYRLSDPQAIASLLASPGKASWRLFPATVAAANGADRAVVADRNTLVRRYLCVEATDRPWVDAVHSALAEPFYLVAPTLAKRLGLLSSIPHVASQVGRLLDTQPGLNAEVARRTDLIRRLLDAEPSDTLAQAVRYLLHGEPVREEPPFHTLFLSAGGRLGGHLDAIFGRLQGEGAAWQIIPASLRDVLLRKDYQRLGVEELSEEGVVRELLRQLALHGAGRVEALGLNDEQAQEALTKAGQYCVQHADSRPLWRGLPLHPNLLGGRGAIGEDGYLITPVEAAALPEALRQELGARLFPLDGPLADLQRLLVTKCWSQQDELDALLAQAEPWKFFGRVASLLGAVAGQPGGTTLVDTARQRPVLPFAGEGLAPAEVTSLRPDDRAVANEVPAKVFGGKCHYSELSSEVRQALRDVSALFRPLASLDVLKTVLAAPEPSRYQASLSALLARHAGRQPGLPEGVREVAWLRHPVLGAVAPSTVIRESEALKGLPQGALRRLIEASGTQWALEADLSLSGREGDLEVLKDRLFVPAADAIEDVIDGLARQGEQFALGDLAALLVDEEALEVRHLLASEPVVSLLPAAVFLVDPRFASTARKLCQPLAVDRLRQVLEALSDLPPRGPVRQAFNLYLGQLAPRLSARAGLPPKMLNGEGEWKPITRLCCAEGSDVVSLSDLLDPEQERILAPFLGQQDELPSAPATEGRTGNEEMTLNEWVNHLYRHVDPTFLGILLFLLSGSNDERKALARVCLGAFSAERLNRELHFSLPLVTPLRFIHAEVGYSDRVSLAGQWFQAAVRETGDEACSLVFKCERQLAAARPTYALELKALKRPEAMGAEVVQESLRLTSRELLVRYLPGPGAEARADELLGRVWEMAKNSTGRAVASTRAFVLQGLTLYLPMIKADRDPQIRGTILDIDNRRLDKMALDDQGEGHSERALAIQKRLNDGLSRLAGQVDQKNDLIVDLVRTKIGEYGYRHRSILPELFQNADDALLQWERLGLARHETQKTVLIDANTEGVSFTHWGRPINRTKPVDLERPVTKHDTDERARLFGYDLRNMLVLNFSNKEAGEAGQTASATGTTGKFGLGFKSCYLFTSRPRVVSENVWFSVAGGILPNVLRPDEVATVRRTLEAFDESVRADANEATIIQLERAAGVAAAVQHDMVAELKRHAQLLTICAQRVEQCVVRDQAGETRYGRMRPLSTNAEVAIEAGERDGTVYLCFRAAHSSRVFVVYFAAGGAKGPAPLDRYDLPTLWHTAPTGECLGVPFAINAPFKLDAGRQRITLGHENQAESALIAEVIHAGLKQLWLEGQGAESWQRLAQAMGVSVGFEAFWTSLWELLADAGAQQQARGAGGLVTSHDMIALTVNRALCRHVEEFPSLPTGLEERALVRATRGLRVLTEQLGHHRAPLAQAFPRFAEALQAGRFASAQAWARYQALTLGHGQRDRSQTLSVDAFLTEFGRGDWSGPVLRLEPGDVRDLLELEKLGLVGETLKERLKLAQLRNQNGDFVPLKKLLHGETQTLFPDSIACRQEAQLVQFMGPAYLFHVDYAGDALGIIKMLRGAAYDLGREIAERIEEIKLSSDASLKELVGQYEGQVPDTPLTPGPEPDDKGDETARPDHKGNEKYGTWGERLGLWLYRSLYPDASCEPDDDLTIRTDRGSFSVEVKTRSVNLRQVRFLDYQWERIMTGTAGHEVLLITHDGSGGGVRLHRLKQPRKAIESAVTRLPALGADPNPKHVRPFLGMVREDEGDKIIIDHRHLLEGPLDPEVWEVYSTSATLQDMDSDEVESIVFVPEKAVVTRR